MIPTQAHQHKKKLTDEQAEYLSRYEGILSQAVNTSSARNPGRDALTKIRQILIDVTGKPQPKNFGCGRCVYNILHSAGVIYFAQRGPKQHAVELSETETETILKADINAEKI